MPRMPMMRAMTEEQNFETLGRWVATKESAESARLARQDAAFKICHILRDAGLESAPYKPIDTNQIALLFKELSGAEAKMREAIESHNAWAQSLGRPLING